jgi:hypothetical protein
MRLGIRRENSTIEFINLMSTDVANIESFATMSGWLIVGPVKAVMIIMVLIRKVNFSILTGLALLCLIIAIQLALSRIAGVFKYEKNLVQNLDTKFSDNKA